MEIKIDDYKMDKSGLSFPEVLVLKLLDDSEKNNYLLSDIIESLQNNGLVCGFSNDNITFIGITNIGQMKLYRIIEDGLPGDNVDEDDKRLEEIAIAMRDVYPKGSKRDDNGVPSYPWKDSVSATKDRLRKFEQNYNDGNKLTLDEAVETTKRYVDSCTKRDPVLLKPMRTLPYFIYKDGESLFRKWLDAGPDDDVFDESNGMTIL